MIFLPEQGRIRLFSTHGSDR